MKNAVFLLALFFSLPGLAQRNVKDSTVVSTHVSMTVGVQIPGADLADRFGVNAHVGAMLSRKTRKNWFYGATFGYMFGNDVTEPGLMQNLLTEDGHIVDNLGRIAEVSVQQRGYYLGFEGGKLFNVLGPNPNCGILVKAGVGVLHHKIRLEHQFHDVTQLEEPYLQGYDRLTNGLATNQFAGYFHMSNSRLINYFIGVEFIEGFTMGRRELNFDTLTTDDARRFDMLVGLKAGWVLHFYSRPPREYYFD